MRYAEDIWNYRNENTGVRESLPFSRRTPQNNRMQPSRKYWVGFVCKSTHGRLILDVICLRTDVQPRTETEIAEQRQRLDAWLSDAYSRQPDVPKNGELEAGYPYWGEIETIFGRVFDQQVVRQLSAASVRSLLFFISRSDECGCIIAWLRPETGTPFSNIGNLTYDDFIFLCEKALSEPDDFCDYQLVPCFQKLAVLNANDEDLLEGFFCKKTDSYTRRMVVHAFAKFRHRKAISLIQQLWSTDECEFAKLSCLYSLEPFIEARALLNGYLKEYQDRFPVGEEDYRRTHVDRLMAIEDK